MKNLDQVTAEKLREQVVKLYAVTNGKDYAESRVKENSKDIICELLTRLGYTETVTEFRKLG